MTRGTLTLTLYGAGLSATDRERILDYLFEALKISPGMVSADGNYELLLEPDLGDPALAPLLEIDGRRFERVSLERLRALFPASRLQGGSVRSRLRS